MSLEQYQYWLDVFIMKYAQTQSPMMAEQYAIQIDYYSRKIDECLEESS